MSQVSHNKRKRKAQYRKGHYGKKAYKQDGGPTNLAAGMRGFIVTCNKKERESSYEVLHLLEDALERISSDDESSASEKELAEEDLEKAMREEAEKELKERKFHVVATGVSNVVFITSSIKNRSPTALVNEVFGELISSRRSQPRYALRLLPVEAVCRVDDIKCLQDSCRELWTDFIEHRRIKKPEKPTFTVDFKSRNFSIKTKSESDSATTTLNKDVAVAAWVDAVKARTPEYGVDMLAPSVVLVTNVLRRCICLSILEFRNEFAKYNLREVLPATAGQEIKNVKNADENDAVEGEGDKQTPESPNDKEID